jgi:hypothetical protein
VTKYSKQSDFLRFGNYLSCKKRKIRSKTSKPKSFIKTKISLAMIGLLLVRRINIYKQLHFMLYVTLTLSGLVYKYLLTKQVLESNALIFVTECRIS